MSTAIKLFVLVITTLLSGNLIGQQFFDFSANIGTQTGTFTYNSLPLSSPDVNKQYIMGFSPAFQLDAFYQKDKIRFGLLYQSREIILSSGFSTNRTDLYPGGGAGASNSYGYRQLSLQTGYVFKQSRKWEQSLNVQLSYFKFRESACLSNPSINPITGISSGGCGQAGSGSTGFDSLGVMIDREIDIAEAFIFKRDDNFLIGLNYNVKYFIKPSFYFSFNIFYNQGLATVFTNNSSYSYENFITGATAYFEHQIQSRLSHASAMVGIGYRLNRRGDNLP